MLRRKPTAIQLTSDDVSVFTDALRRRQLAQASQNQSAFSPGANQNGANGMMDTDDSAAVAAAQALLDPNDELRPLPGERGKGRTRDERIGFVGGGGSSRG